MSDEANTAPGMGAGVRPDASTPFAASRGLLRAAGHPARDTDQLAAFVQQQPLTAAVVALAVGFVLGKISQAMHAAGLSRNTAGGLC
nr:hypothetical protein [uncultured Rhodopila sp.]